MKSDDELNRLNLNNKAGNKLFSATCPFSNEILVSSFHLTLASLSLAFSARFSYLLGCFVNAVVVLEFVGIMGGEVFFICRFRPSPFELFHSDIAMRL